jgi:hypothetical protein
VNALTQDQRNLLYASVVIDLTGVDRKDIEGRPPNESFLILLKASEERGVTLDDWQAWSAQCDTADDPEKCFRKLATPAYRGAPSLGRIMAISGVFWFAVGFGVTVLVRRRRAA